MNLIFHGKPVLIEAGTPSYGHPRIHSHFSTGYGHNVLQIGLAEMKDSNTKRPAPRGWQKNHAVAPITVHRLDNRGGEVTVTGDRCYDGLKQWRRHVTWDAAKLQVQDSVELAADKKDVILFRWHLGTGRRVALSQDADGTVTVRWPDAKLTLHASQTIEVTQANAPDATLLHRAKTKGAPEHLHTCLTVRTKDKVHALKLTTTVTPAG